MITKVGRPFIIIATEKTLISIKQYLYCTSIQTGESLYIPDWIIISSQHRND
jgi:hypothetical protein